MLARLLRRSAGSFALLAGLLSASVAAHASLAVPQVTMQDDTPEVEYVVASQGYLGVDLRDVDESRAQQLKLKAAQGAEIVALDHDAPACKAGLRAGDVITAIDGQAVTNAEQVHRMLRDLPAGRHVTIAVARSGKPVEVKLQLADREVLAQQAWKRHFHVPAGAPMINGFAGERGFLSPGYVMPPAAGSAQHMGVLVRPLGPQLAAYFGAPEGTGLLIENVEAESAAAAAGLKAGDVILKANGTAMTSPMDLVAAIRDAGGKPFQLNVLRDHHEQNVTVTVQGMKTESELLPGIDPGHLAAEIGPEVAELQKDALSGGVDLEKLRAQLADSQRASQRALAQAQKELREHPVQVPQIDTEAIRKQLEQLKNSRQISEQAMAAAQKELREHPVKVPQVDMGAIQKQLEQLNDSRQLNENALAAAEKELREHPVQVPQVDMQAIQKQIEQARKAVERQFGSGSADLYPY